MRKIRTKIYELLVLVFMIVATGCGKQKMTDLSEDTAAPQTMESAETDDSLPDTGINDETGAIPSDNAGISEPGENPQEIIAGQDEPDADDIDRIHADMIPPFIERSIAGVRYRAPYGWQMYESTDDQFLQHVYYDTNNGRPREFLEICYVSSRDMGMSADKMIETLLTYMKEQEYCDRYTEERKTLESGVDAICYSYHLTDVDYTEYGYYVNVNDQGALSVFYEPERIENYQNVLAIEQLVNSISFSATSTAENVQGEQDANSNRDEQQSDAGHDINKSDEMGNRAEMHLIHQDTSIIRTYQRTARHRPMRS